MKIKEIKKVMRFKPCSCSIFCIGCLLDELWCDEGNVFTKIYYHIVWHTPLGLILLWKWSREGDNEE